MLITIYVVTFQNKYLFINRNNSYFDFGAWNFLIKNFQEIYNSDWILFINDTFNKDYKNHIKLFNIEILQKYIGKNMLLDISMPT